MSKGCDYKYMEFLWLWLCSVSRSWWWLCKSLLVLIFIVMYSENVKFYGRLIKQIIMEMGTTSRCVQRCMSVCSFAAVVSDSETALTRACQVPLSMIFSRQEYYSVLPCPTPGNLPNPGIKPKSPAPPALQTDSLPTGSTEPPGKPLYKTSGY